MSRNIYIIFICILYNTITFVYAQESNSYIRRIVSLSPSDQVVDKFRFNPQSHIADIIYRNPALYEWQNKKGSFVLTTPYINDTISSTLLRKTIIGLRYYNGKTSGDYLPYMGNAFTDAEINADAILGTAEHGTIFGSASFSKGRHSNYGWNAIRHPELYLPYLIADSTGGNYRYENYYISGGYSFHINKCYYGVGGSFRGEIASRQTDPRCANTTSWLILDAAAAFPINSKSWLSIRSSYIWNKQYLHLRNWRPNQQDRFFVTYGFGYYDLQESPVSFGIRRMYYIKGTQTQITYSNLGLKDCFTNITADINYSFLTMKTEEANAKNLFGSDTHHINSSLWLNSKQNNILRWTLGIQSNNQLRKGKENIYETYRPDENYPSIYDFRKVDTRKRYAYTFSSNLLQCKIEYYLSKPQLILEILCGIGTDYRSEHYKDFSHHWSIWSTYPMLGFGTKQKSKNFSWGINSLFIMKSPLQYSYNVTGGKFRIDYQETFLPYAFYTDKSVNFRNEIYVSFPINKYGQRIGLNLQHFIRNGVRPSGIEYAGTPGIMSHLLSQPIPGKVKNHESWISAGLFIIM